jgi:hypothetical protein
MAGEMVARASAWLQRRDGRGASGWTDHAMMTMRLAFAAFVGAGPSA